MGINRIHRLFISITVKNRSVMKRLAVLILCMMTTSAALADDDAGSSLSPPSRLHVGGFADVVLRSAPTNTARHVAELDMYSTFRISDAWSFLAEGIAQRTWRPPEASEKPSIDLNLERLYVTYQTSDAFRLEIGETHTGIVRWNEREHRSRFLQTSIEVPAIARQPQDDGAWPTRFVGLWASGQTQSPLRFKWEGGAGAGPGSDREAIPIFSDNLSPALFASVSVSPQSMEGLESGFAVYGQHIPSKPEILRERDLTVFSNYVNHGTEIRAEWARMDHHRAHLRQVFRNQGYYVLVSKRLSGPVARARPYVLLDHLNIDRADPYLQEATNENAWAAGVRYDFTARFSAKGEFRSQRALDGSRRPIIGLQIGVFF